MTHWKCCAFFVLTSATRCTLWYVSVENDCWTNVCCISICLLTGIVAHIYILEANDVQNYTNTLFSWTCLLLYCEYDNHEVLQSSYRFLKFDFLFNQTFYFARCDFGFWVVSDYGLAVLTREFLSFGRYTVLTTTYHLVPCRYLIISLISGQELHSIIWCRVQFLWCLMNHHNCYTQ